MDFKKFCFYTFIGCLPWSFALTYAGVVLEHNWAGIRVYFEKFEIVIGLALVIGIAWWVRRHISCTCKITKT
jgi:membrane protein DedA with SNARE-associated domain